MEGRERFTVVAMEDPPSPGFNVMVMPDTVTVEIVDVGEGTIIVKELVQSICMSR